MSVNLSLNINEMEEYLLNTYEFDIMDKPSMQYVFRFPNNYGASVIKSYGTMGYEQDKWELAAILFEHDENIINVPPTSDEWMIVYPVSIFTDRMPLGYLTDEQVYNILKDLKKLK